MTSIEIGKWKKKGILDPDSEVDLFCLHLVFLLIIQKQIDEFTIAWNHHGITPGSSSPIWLFIRGLAALRRLAAEQQQTFTELKQACYKNELYFISLIHCEIIAKEDIDIYDVDAAENFPDFVDAVEVPKNLIRISRRMARRLKVKYGSLRCRLPLAIKKYEKARREVLRLLTDEWLIHA